MYTLSVKVVIRSPKFADLTVYVSGADGIPHPNEIRRRGVTMRSTSNPDRLGDVYIHVAARRTGVFDCVKAFNRVDRWKFVTALQTGG